MDRLDRIFAYKQELARINEGFNPDGVRLDLLSEPGFAQMTFMKRRARLIEATLQNVKVRLFPEELLAGTFYGTWVDADFTTYEERRTYGNMNHEYDRRNKMRLADITEYVSKAREMTDEEVRDPDTARWNWGHSCGGFPRILEMGYEGIARDAEARIAAMQASGTVDPEKIEFWEAVITSVRAVCALSVRYADALDKESEAAQDEKRRDELIALASVMRRVPARSAETFHEALQSVWFSFMCSVRFSGTDLGRFDQYIYPYYRKDIDSGILTESQAEELLGSFFLKCFESYASQPENAGLHPSIMLGGLNADGKDGINDISIMCLRMTERFRTPVPKLSVRINEQTPDEVFSVAHRMLLSGINQPDFYMDRVILPAFERIGIPFADAVQYAQSICEEVSLAGISEDCTNEGIHCDVHDKVKLAMERVAKGERADTFEAFFAIVEQEMRKNIQQEKEFHTEQTEKIRRFGPQPLHSAGIVGCLESGKDIMAGGAKYNNTGSLIGGLATAADGMYAIRKLVYEDKRLTMAEFYRILEDEFTGQEFLRAEILHKFPKFGNDDDRVDDIAVRLFDIFADEVEKGVNSRGGRYKVGAWASAHRNWHGATPDGRRRGDAFATNISPTPGKDIKGVTAVIRSGTKINMRCCTAGAMLDVAMNPSCIRGENGAEIVKQIVTVYGNLGGGALQFNIIDSEMLRRAKEDPSKYRNLMVRVWGYNDYFTALPEDRQNHIISRTIHGSL